MGYQEVEIGNQPEDGLGDGLRTAFGKVNSNTKELFELTVIIDGRRVARFISDPANDDIYTYREEDIIEGWYDTNKERWVKALVVATNAELTSSALNLPADFDDESKIFLLEDKLKV